MARGLKTVPWSAYKRPANQICSSALSQAKNFDSLLQLQFLLTGLIDFLESVLAHLQVCHTHITYLFSVYICLLISLDMKPLCLDVTQAGPIL